MKKRSTSMGKREEPQKSGSEAKSPEAEEQPGSNADVVAAPEKTTAADEKKLLEDRLLRLQADFENFRKRVERERAELARRALEEFVGELLSVVDHFELGLRAAEQHQADASVQEGFRQVYRQLMRLLEKHGIRPIEAVGRLFDPHIHEAVAHVPSEEHPENVVVAETRRGYMIGDRLLRASRVVVSAGPPQSVTDEGQE